MILYVLASYTYGKLGIVGGEAAASPRTPSAAVNNRANQLNPNHAQYHKSRCHPVPEGLALQQLAQKSQRRRSAQGHFQLRSQNCASKERVDPEMVNAFLACGRRYVKGLNIRRTGSMKKGTDIQGSDFDYHVETAEPMTVEAADSIVSCLKEQGFSASRSKAIKVGKLGSEHKSIDFFPPHARWHVNVPVQQPVEIAPGERASIRMLKHSVGHKLKHGNGTKVLPSYMWEELAREVTTKKAWGQAKDPSGERRFQEVQRIVVEARRLGHVSGGHALAGARGLFQKGGAKS